MFHERLSLCCLIKNNELEIAMLKVILTPYINRYSSMFVKDFEKKYFLFKGLQIGDVDSGGGNINITWFIVGGAAFLLFAILIIIFVIRYTRIF